MTVYLLVLAWTLVMGSIAQHLDLRSDVQIDDRHPKHSLTCCLAFTLALLGLICVAGFRYNVGADYSAYYAHCVSYADQLFEKTATIDEPGISAICYLVLYLGGDSAACMFAASAITIGLLGVVVYRNTDKLLMALLLLLFLGCWHSSFNAIRQCLAVAVLFTGFGFLKRRELPKYFAVVAIAFLFHRSALIAAFFPLLVVFDYNEKRLILTILIMILGSLLFERVFEFMGVIDAKFDTDTEYSERSVSVLRILVAVAPALLFCILRRGQENNRIESVSMNILLLHAVLMVVSGHSAYVARLALYTAPFCAIAIPELSQSIRLPQNQKRILMGTMMILFTVFWLFNLYNSSSLNTWYWVFDYV